MDQTGLLQHIAHLHHEGTGWCPSTGTWGWFWMFIGTVALIVITILIIYLLFKEDGVKNTKTALRRPEDIIDERYARGEISTKEYREKKKEIR